jgi:peptide subunit release factor 1 (eRF1)
VVGSLHLSIDAGTGDILKATTKLGLQVEREGEQSLIGGLLTAAAKERYAVVGLEETLSALRQGRIRTLVYSAGTQARGVECRNCGSLFEESTSVCPVCSGDVSAVEDLLEAVTSKVFSQGGSVEHLRQEPAAAFQQQGEGIGAYLRF